MLWKGGGVFVANTHVTFKELRFEIEPDCTRVTVIYTSDEPDNPIWGGGTKRKNFQPDRSVTDILQKEIANMDFLTW